ncbi:M16 family metallopeptidase [Desulfurobacterium crinifex]
MEFVELENGLKVILNHVDGLDILACAVFLPGGSSVEPGSKTGITVLSLKTAFKRSLKRSSLEFAKVQEQLGTPFVSDVSNDYSFIKFQIVPDGLKEYMELLQEVIEEPGFTEESFSVEKETLLAAIRSRKENPFSLAYEKLMALTYSGTPYEKLPYGSESTVKPLTLEDAGSWFKDVVLPQNTLFSFCGELKHQEKVLDLLNELRTKEVKQSFPFVEEIEDTEELEVKRKGSSQVFIMVCVNAPSVFQEEFIDYKLFNTLLGEGIGSLLFQELREKRGFAYSTGSFFPSRRSSGRLFFYIGTSPEKEKEVRKALLELKERLPEFVTEENVRRAKQFFRGNFELDHETRMKKAWYLGVWEILGRGTSFDKEILDLVGNIPLSRLKEVAERIASEPYHMVVIKDG